jgi:hypothetical protein
MNEDPIFVVCADMTHSPWENPRPLTFLLSTVPLELHYITLHYITFSRSRTIVPIGLKLA